ncbi:MAG: hypothetical protein JWO95_1311, partial [Verrucomicrobiales bacterium]|nr:hypothetical protein [Verrucomicrobiales bacterium]
MTTSHCVALAPEVLGHIHLHLHGIFV